MAFGFLVWFHHSQRHWMMAACFFTCTCRDGRPEPGSDKKVSLFRASVWSQSAHLPSFQQFRGTQSRGFTCILSRLFFIHSAAAAAGQLEQDVLHVAPRRTGVLTLFERSRASSTPDRHFRSWWLRIISTQGNVTSSYLLSVLMTSNLDKGKLIVHIHSPNFWLSI